MHEDEVCTDSDLVLRLIVSQFPHWADLSIERVKSSGTDNALYRLGDDMLVRLPRIYWAVGQVKKEQFWLPQLAPLLPLEIPEPVAMGTPAEGYPWHWSVYRWLEGENTVARSLENPSQFAEDLAQFVAALHHIDPTGVPPPGGHKCRRQAR